MKPLQKNERLFALRLHKLLKNNNPGDLPAWMWIRFLDSIDLIDAR